jgi:hypothetical protein
LALVLVWSCACARADAPRAEPGDGGASDLAPVSDRVLVGTERATPSMGRVYAHHADQLYLYDPISRLFTLVGVFGCVSSMVDIAVDRSGNIVGTALAFRGTELGGVLTSIDPATGGCQIINDRTDPLTSLTWVPAGALLPGEEALVGYDEDRYMRIDPATGVTTQIGTLNGPASGGTRWVSSGDIVSIVDAGTFLTVMPGSGPVAGGDRIVEVDPATGELLRIIGATGHDYVYGLGYWGGVAYGFTLGGALIQIDLGSGAGDLIPIPPLAGGGGLSFNGAGTTTIAPIRID